ncbi:MAG: CapA family protein [Chloroflexi bacterium]|nr:CapA family protein [Chloroflexota bacterium]
MPRLSAAWLVPLLFILAACGDGGSVLTPATSPTLSPAGTPTASPQPTATEPPEESVEVTLHAVGDVMLGRTLGDGIRRSGPLYPFEPVLDLLRDADITFANLESPLSERGEPAPKDFVFRGPTEGAEGLAQAGIDIVSLANNHALDYGLTALADTRAALAAAGVLYAGAGGNEAGARAPVIVGRKGLRLAFLAYVNTPSDSGSGFDVSGTAATAGRAGVAWATAEAVAADVAAARGQADIVIVSLHTGPEYQEPPSPLQVEVARAAIDAGAALVLGHHPHVLQGIERYKRGLIIYSLGNFVFDFDSVDYAHPGLPSALSAVLRVRLSEEGVLGCRVLPVVIAEGDGRPRPAAGAGAQAVLDRLARLSDGCCGLG